MSKNLVIVESPAKAKTIEKFLGKDYVVASSFGHVADLPKKEMGIDVEGDFKPKYIISPDKKDVIKNLKSLAKKADTIWLASDEDREGEAIAWHLFHQLKLKDENTKRIVFHEITKKAIDEAVKNPRKIDENLVDAQQARRVLDRLVGYELSPVLWKKVKTGLSAGRVQSVAVRLIVEREREIEEFTPTATYKVEALFLNEKKQAVSAKLDRSFKNKEEAKDFLTSCLNAAFQISDLSKKPAKKKPAAPFTTSTLQQEASRKLYFPVAKTMQTAQRLYEAGYITYMRTDSVTLSDEAKKAAAKVITANYGSKYSKIRNYTSKTKGAQEAHEAIRPTNFEVEDPHLNADQSRLYQLIWKRAVASQMADADIERTKVSISNDKNSEIFTANGEVIKFPGFLKVYIESFDDEDAQEQTGHLPELKVGETMFNENIVATERFSRPPFRYSEAALVKKLEELGIGRPSTYAPTISTIQRRMYVEKKQLEGVKRNYTQLILQKEAISEKKLTEITGADKGKLMPTDIGKIVNDFLVANFQQILDYDFTARAEKEFDDIAEGKGHWKETIQEFYKGFIKNVNDVSENADRAKGERELGIDPKSGKKVYARLGRYGAMVQIGEVSDEEKPRFASLQGTQTISSINLEEALALFELPKTLGEYEGEEVIVSNGRYGPFVKFGKKYISLPKTEDPSNVDFDRAIELIEAKKRADAPIATYKELPVQKGVGRFGPFIKWNNTFINVSKKYNFDDLSQKDIEELIEDKLKKEREKVIKNWETEGIRLEKARWGRFNLIQGKNKVELPKTTDPEKITLEKAQEIITKNTKATRKKRSKK